MDPRPAFSRYLRPRALWIALVVVLAVVHKASLVVPPSADEEGLRAALATASQAAPVRVAWEPKRGPIVEYLFGRPLLFEATPEGSSQSDIFRAFVRLLPDGTPLSVHRARNLTATKLANETGLSAADELALYATVTDGAPAGLTALKLEGEQAAEGVGPLGRLQLIINRYLTTGDFQGLGRADVTLPPKTSSVHARWDETKKDEVRLTIDGRQWPLPLDALEVASGKGGDAARVQAPVDVFVRQPEPAPLLHWLADTGRAFVGTSAIAWLEGRVFSAMDEVKQLGYSVAGPEKTKPSRPSRLSPTKQRRPGTWPPENLDSRFEQPHEGEGRWRPANSELLRRDDFEGEPLPIYRTFIRPDPERPYAKLHLVAMDMRRLELGIRAGYEDPRPETGPPGSGHVPKRPEVYERIVATFNGAFKATHGSYGMKAEGRVLVPPKPGTATVLVDHEGRAGMGTWQRSTEAPKPKPTHDQPTLERTISLRQNMDALVDGEAINPAGRQVWGDQLYGKGVAAERSALCVTGSGHLIYGWSQEVTGESLAQGMAQADCIYAMHLDMNPGHCSFLFNQIESFDPLVAKGEVLHPDMKVNETRYIRWSPKDFFYLARRRAFPAPTTEYEFEWSKSPGAQPLPTSLPTFVRGKAKLGHLTVNLLRADLKRLDLLAVPGIREPGAAPEALSPKEAARVLAVFGVGHSTRGVKTGLSVNETILVPFHRGYASLILDADGAPRILPPGKPPVAQPGRTVVQLPAWARDGEVTEEARDLGGKKDRAGLCINEEGYLLVGRVHHDTAAPLVRTMIDLGCSLVVEMDRGSHSPPLLERAKTDHPPREGHAQTALYALSSPMRPGAYRF